MLLTGTDVTARLPIHYILYFASLPIKQQFTKANGMHVINRASVATIFLLLLALAQPFLTEAQSKPSKWRNAADSLVIVESNLSRWHAYGGVHLSSDAELYYAGPSFQAGADIDLKKRLAFSGYIHYFHGSVNNIDNSGFTEKGRFRTFTSALLIQLNAGAGWYKGFSWDLA